ncbi:hypothetical protein ANRL2_04446 [Anaerolineae bacterium]|nr:hypothetical protein ANRL2_04446 [Anaerolineae bacterium]
MISCKVGALVDDVFTLVVRCIDFSLGSQPVFHRITAIESAMFGMEIGSDRNLLMMLGCVVIEQSMLGCLVIDGSLFMQSFCSVYGM